MNTFVRNNSHQIPFCTFYLSIPSCFRIDVQSFDRGVFRTYSIIHPYLPQYRVVHTKCPLHLSCNLLDNERVMKFICMFIKEDIRYKMERPDNTNYPYVHKKPQSLDSFLYIPSIYPFLLPVLIYNVVSFNRGVLRTYSMIHP